MRLDIYMSENGYADSRQKAKTMITDGVVYINGVCVKKPAAEVLPGTEIEIRGEVCPYVGRGGYKLEGALKAFHIDPHDFTCVDIGSSTGGFTDCLLQNGAFHVWAVDSGTDQLAEKLRTDTRVTVCEGYNARNLDLSLTGSEVMLAVCDVSFISITYMFEPAMRVLCPYDPKTRAGSFLALIKPQFEAGRAAVGKNGIIRDEKVHLRVVLDVIRQAQTTGLSCLGVAPSPIKGGDGNREFLAHFAKQADAYTDLSLSDPAVLKKKIMADSRAGE